MKTKRTIEKDQNNRKPSAKESIKLTNSNAFARNHGSRYSNKLKMRSSTMRFETSSTSEDHRSHGSASSCATIVESRSPKQNVGQLRKFTASVGKPGQAREARAAVRTVLGAINPMRKSPLSGPLDYEKFITENGSSLENNSQRDLLLFPRDDVAETLLLPEEDTVMPSVAHSHLMEAHWLLTQEALSLYSSPCRIISFNYANFANGLSKYKYELPNDLPVLIFESDLAMNEEKTMQNDVSLNIIREGHLLLVPDGGILDNFKSMKKRYCVLKYDKNGKLLLEVQKISGVNSPLTTLVIGRAALTTTRKGKNVLEISGTDPDRKSIMLTADNDETLPHWLIEIERALTVGSIGKCTVLNSASSSSTLTSCISSDTESLSIDENIPVVMGQTAAVKALQPSIINRINLFSLYSVKEQRGSADAINRSSLYCDIIQKETDHSDKTLLRFIIEFFKIDINLPISNTEMKQVEPFFVRFFLFDARTGRRISEEFNINPNSDEINSLLKTDENKLKRSCFIENGTYGIPYEQFADAKAYKVIYSVLQPHSDIYLVIRVERLLTLDSSADLYIKNGDLKNTMKFQKILGLACNKLSHNRMPFAWTARPLFQEMLGFRTKLPEGLQLFRSDNSKLSENDLQKFLLDFSRNEKSTKLTLIPGATISVNVDVSSKIEQLPMRINASFMPIRPWNAPADTLLSACFEVQMFDEIIKKPHKKLFNILYVYPLTLKYDNQKAFSKARNIACSVQFVAATSRGKDRVQAIFDRFAYPIPFISSKRCAVLYHEQNPTFTDEIKMQLPILLDTTDHILFSFTHISVATALSVKSTSETVETPIGYAWLPLVKGDRLVLENEEQEIALPVAYELPTGYINYQSLGLGKGHSGPEIRWIDGGKLLFRVRLRLVSSAFTFEPKLQSFFQSCQKLQRAGIIGDAADKANRHGSIRNSPPIIPVVRSSSPITDECSVEDTEKYGRYICKKVEALLEVNIEHIVPFLPIVLNRLLSLLPATISDDMACYIIRTLVGIIDKTADFADAELLQDFVRNNFYCSIVKYDSTMEAETTHSAIFKYLASYITIETDDKAITTILRQMWLFLEVSTKSIAQRVLELGLHKLPRKNRFSPELLYRIDMLVEKLFAVIVNKHRSITQECRQANIALANFLRSCLSFIDRGAVFGWIYSVVDKFDQTDSRILRDFKLEMLEVIVGHEHWLPLCLPILLDSSERPLNEEHFNQMEQKKQSTSGNSASSGFLSSFFNKIFSTTVSNHQAHNIIIHPLTAYSHEFELSESYCRHHFPIGLLFQEINASLRDSRDYRRRALALLRSLLAKHATDRRYKTSQAQLRIAMLYLPLIRLAVENLVELEAVIKTLDLSDLSFIARASRVVGVEEKMDSNEWKSLSTEGKSYSESTMSHSTSFAALSMSTKVVQETHIAGLPEKLDKVEARDILICVIYIIHHLSANILGAMWMYYESKGLLLEFVRLFEVALELFRYNSAVSRKHSNSGRQRMKISYLLPTASNARQSTMSSQTSSGVSSADTGYSKSPLNYAGDETEGTNMIDNLREVYLTQQVALVVLDVVQSLSQQIADRNKPLVECEEKKIFSKLLSIQLRLVDDCWPQEVRLNSISGLAVFLKLFRKHFFQSSSLDALSVLIEVLLLLLNSRLPAVQRSSAALLHLVLRNGYDYASQNLARQAALASVMASEPGIRRTISFTERLGRPGSQMGVALARLLGQKIPLANSNRFHNGLSMLQSFVVPAMGLKSTVFERAVQELIKQLRGVLSATGALTEAINDPIRLADLNVQLADSYRGSAALRCAWFESLAEAHTREQWFSEAAVCHAHVVAIMAKELSSNDLLKVDWSLFNLISEEIVKEEKVFDEQSENTQQAGFTLENFTSKIEKIVRSLVLSERYEAVGPICRLAIPVFEKEMNFRSLVDVYAELQQAYSLADQVKANRKRHLGSYFKVSLYGKSHFKDEHETEWIYREPGLTSLAAACERMIEAFRNALGHERIQIIAEHEFDKSSTMNDEIAYIQLTHVEPYKTNVEDLDDFTLHTNVRQFRYEISVIDETIAKDTPDLARQALKRIIVTVDSSLPNVKRRMRVVDRIETLLTPLELARDKLLYKAAQIRRILGSFSTSGISKKELLKNLDIKGLQLLLQGAVQPTVNVGPLAYAEAFTSPSQIEKYGDAGLKSLADAFRVLLTECNKALQVNEEAIGADQLEYQNMLKNAYDAMHERLQTFFGNKFSSTPTINESVGVPADIRTSVHVFDSISGLTS